MDKDINPISAAIVIIALLAMIVVYAWFTGEVNAIRGPGPMAVDSQGALYIGTSRAILKFDGQQRLVQEFALEKIGIQQLSGDIAVFSSGDVLLSAEATQAGFVDRLLPPTVESKGDIDGTGNDLLRCKLETFECRKFTKLGISFKWAFRLEIDPRTDEVYLADTERHLIRKFDSQGRELITNDEGWRFPNGLKLAQDKLYVTNRDSGTIRVLDPATMQLVDPEGQAIKPFIEGTANVKPIGPIHVTPVGDEWWTIWFSLRNGSYRAISFDHDWKYKRTLQIPATAMPMTMVNYAGAVLISDPERFAITRYDHQGRKLDDFSPPALMDHIHGLRELQQGWRTRGYGIMGGLGLVMVLGFVYAFATGKKPASTSRTLPELRPSTIDPRILNIGWLKPARYSSVRISMLFSRTLLLLSLLGIPVMWMYSPETPKVYGAFFILLLLSILLLFEGMARTLGLKSRIGIGGKCLLIKDPKGRVIAAPVEDVMYSARMLYLVDAEGNVNLARFDTVTKKDKERFLDPRLKHSLQLSRYQEQLLWAKVKKPMLLFNLPMLVLVSFPVVLRFLS